MLGSLFITLFVSFIGDATQNCPSKGEESCDRATGFVSLISEKSTGLH